MGGRCSDAMFVELRVEETAEEYKPDVAGNRLEVYESLLLDTSSALWRELVYRKERRSASSASHTDNAVSNAGNAVDSAAENTEKSNAVFDIDSEEEKPLPVKDPSRDVGVSRVCEA